MHDHDASIFFRFRWVVIATIGLPLVGLSYTGVVVFQQTDSLQAAVEKTERIIDGNVRVYSQAQRELLRLAFAVGVDSDVVVLDRHRQLVAQRVQEGTLSYQVDTLGTPLLLDEAIALADRWRSRATPMVQALIDGEEDPTLRAALLEEIDELELGYNRLVSDSEINRRNIAGAANAATGSLLGRSRGLLKVGISTLAVLIALSGFLATIYGRFDRQRVETGQRLARLNSELRTLSQVAAHTSNIVVITDADGRITWVNDAFTEVTGYTPEEAAGRSPGTLLQGPDTDADTVAEMSAFLRAGEGFTREVLNYTKDGRTYWVQIEVRAVHDDDGEVGNFIAVQTDVTAQRELEHRLRTAKEVAEQAAEAKSSFLASMSHEIRTPLNAVIGLNSLLLETDLTARQLHYAETAYASGQMLLAIINDILSYSATESGAMELEARRFVMHAVVEETLELLQHQAEHKGLDLDVRLSDRTAPLVGDPTRLKQVLLNLVGNAVKFTDRGAVTVAVDQRPTADGTATLQIRVSDTGIGIPADRMQRLFQPFSQVDASTTRRFGGSGLGLVICRDLVELMGGDIAVRSEPGHGTEVTVDLRLAVATDAGPDAPPERSSPDVLPPLRVLLAEDDPVNQMVATHMLAQLGTDDVMVVETGVAALAALQEADFDLVLMDVQMPEMDGPTAVRHIRGRSADRRQPWVIGFTASALHGDRERLIEGGMDGYLAKPVQLEDLTAVLRDVPRRSGATSAAAG